MDPDEQKAALYDQARADGMSHEQAITFAESGGRSGSRGMLRGIVAPAVQGATFGFGDELVGGVRGALSPDLTIGEAIEAERGEYDRFAGEHPIISAVTEIGTGVATGTGALRALRGIPQVARAAKGLKSLTGARRLAANTALATAGGAAYGAGAAEGGVSDRLGGAARTAAYTAPLAAAAPLVLSGAGRAVSHGASRIRERANQQVLRGLERSGRTLDDVAADVAAAGDKPVALIDVGGENLRGLGRLVGNIPGEGRETMMRRMFSRAEGQGARVIDDLEKAFGEEAGDVVQMADDIIARRSEQAAPLYRRAHSQSVTITDNIRDAISDPTFKRAYERGQRIARLEGDDLEPIGTYLAGRGGMVGEAQIPVKAIDYMKRGMDDLIDSRYRSGSIGRTEARALKDRLRSVLKEVDEAVPDFAEARAVYAGDSAMLEALDEGRRVLRMRPAEIRKSLQGLTESEADMFRRGALEELRYRVSSTRDTSDAVGRIFGDSETRNRLAELFPSPEAFSEFGRRMGLESEMQLSKNVVGAGSRTFPMQAEAADFGGQLMASASQGKLGFIRAVGRWLQERVWEKTAGEVADILSAGAGEGSAAEAIGRVAGRQSVQDILDDLARTAEAASQRRTRTAVGAVAAGGVVGRQGQNGLRGGEDDMSNADLWDLKVDEGMSPDEATRYVQNRRGSGRRGGRGSR